MDINIYKGIDLNNIESVKVAVDTWHQVAVKGLFIRKKEHERLMREKDNTIANLNQQVNFLINQEKKRLADVLEACYIDKQSKELEYNKLKQELEILRDDILKLNQEKENWQLQEVKLNKKIKFLEAKLKGKKKPLKDLLVDIWLKVVKG